jgi:hypothetical protein
LNEKYCALKNPGGHKFFRILIAGFDNKCLLLFKKKEVLHINIKKCEVGFFARV